MLWGYGELKSIAARRAASTGLCIIDSVIVAYALFGHRRLFHCPWMAGLYLLTAILFLFFFVRLGFAYALFCIQCKFTTFLLSDFFTEKALFPINWLTN